MKCFQMSKQGRIMTIMPYKSVGLGQDGPHQQILGRCTATRKLDDGIDQAMLGEVCGILAIRLISEYGRQQYSCLHAWRRY